MPETRECDYCGADIEPGTGTMLVRKNGTTVHYCSAKCEKNADLGREARDLNWTAAGRESDRQETVAAEREAEAEAEADAAAETDDEAAETDDEAPDAEDADTEDADEEDTEESDAAPDLEDAESGDEESDEDEQAEEAQA